MPENEKNKQEHAEKKPLKLPEKTKKRIDAALEYELGLHCDFEDTRKQLEAAFEEEENAYIEKLKNSQKALETMDKLYNDSMQGNAVYNGEYHNEPEKKNDARNALIFAKGCVDIQSLLVNDAMQYGALGLKRMALGAGRKRPNDKTAEDLKKQVAEKQAHEAKSLVKQLLALIPLVVGIICIVLYAYFRNNPWPLLSPMLSPALMRFTEGMIRFFYGSGLGVGLIVAIVGSIIASFALYRTNAKLKSAVNAYVQASPVLDEMNERDAELQKFYDEQSAKAKEHSDFYFDTLNNNIIGKLIKGYYLAPFPAEFTGASDLEAGAQLLDSSRAENLKEVYDILERRHAENARMQAEAQHRAKIENISMEQLRSQQNAEAYAKQQAEYAKKQADYAKQQAAAADAQAKNLAKIAEESEKQTDYARQQADIAASMQSDIDYMRRNNP